MTSPLPGAPVARDAASHGGFLLVSCQPGAETAVAERMGDLVPGSRRGAWRRGVVTFRLPAGGDPAEDFFPEDLCFAATVIHCRGQVADDTVAALVDRAVALAGPGPWRNVHVWPRDPRDAADIEAIRGRLLAACGLEATLPPVAAAGERVLDVLLDSETRWWVGSHRAASPPSRWPGGRYPATLPEGKVSRAWLKLDEAIASFGIPFAPGERACEFGAAPGGSCLRLLEAGLAVVGVDPAVIDERVTGHPAFTHWRMRSRDVRLRACRGFDWIVSDMNIAPERTLEAIGRVVTAPDVRPRGIVATLKLPRWSQAAALPQWLDTFRAWGFAPRCRQLSTSGREVCVVALAARGRRGITPPARRARPRRER